MRKKVDGKKKRGGGKRRAPSHKGGKKESRTETKSNEKREADGIVFIEE